MLHKTLLNVLILHFLQEQKQYKSKTHRYMIRKEFNEQQFFRRYLVQEPCTYLERF